MNLSAIDLNLLVYLDALIKEQNVSKASKRVGLSQSAMSNALNRLRSLFEDPLLVRSSRGMRLTPLAEELAEPVDQILKQVLQTFRIASNFDPSTTFQNFSIVASDYIEYALISHLIPILAKTAPGISLELFPFGSQLPEVAMERGELDLAFDHVIPDSHHFHYQLLFREEFLCAVRPGHPKLKDNRLTLEDYISVPHVLVSSKGRVTGVVDKQLRNINLKRQVAVTIPHFMTAPKLVFETDYVITLAKRVALAYAEKNFLHVFEPPLEIPSFGVYMVWHNRTDQDPAHQWIREQFVELGKNL